MVQNTKTSVNLILLLFIGFAVIVYRLEVLNEFAFIWTDSDQAIMWHALQQYSEGSFNEPRFYGQAYNSMIEAFIASPLYLLGVSPHIALPIMTSFLSLFPFFLISYLAWKNKSPYVGLLIISIPLMLPLEYHMITSLSRGFVTGVFLVSLGAFALFKPYQRWSNFIFAFIIVIGFSLNANSAIISIPCLIYLLLHQKKNRGFYLYFISGIVSGSLIHLLINAFYYLNPEYVIHDFHLSYSFTSLFDSFDHLDRFFNHVSPIFWNSGFIWLIIFIIAGIISLLFKERKVGFFFFSIPLLLISTLGLSKVNDGSSNIFFPYSRMFIALPVLVAFGLLLIPNIRKQHFFLLVIPFLFFFYSITRIRSEVSTLVNPYEEDLVVAVAKTERILNRCRKIERFCKRNKIELVVVLNDYDYDFINYGCSACTDDFPSTLRPSYERRVWRIKEEEDNIHKNILFLDNDTKLDQKFNFIQTVGDSKRYFICKDNNLTTKQLFYKMNIHSIYD